MLSVKKSFAGILWVPPVSLPEVASNSRHLTCNLGLPHRTTEDDIHEGFFIPSGSLIIPNLWSVCLWGLERSYAYALRSLGNSHTIRRRTPTQWLSTRIVLLPQKGRVQNKIPANYVLDLADGVSHVSLTSSRSRNLICNPLAASAQVPRPSLFILLYKSDFVFRHVPCRCFRLYLLRHVFGCFRYI